MSKHKGKRGVMKKILVPAICLAAVVLIAFVVANMYIAIKSRKYIVSDIHDLPDKVDAIIVLGAGLAEGNSPGTVLTDRLDTAIELYNAGVSDRLLMSGDHDDYHNEVLAMKEYAINKGVPADDIFMDHKGYTTYDTMTRAKNVFQVNTCIVVTQTYHLMRAVYIARGVGLDAYGYSSEIHIDQLKYVPLEIREFLARVKAVYSVFTYDADEYKDEEAIPITGSGEVTD